MNMWDFFNQHEFLAWCALWLLWVIIPTFHALIIAIKLIVVLFRGWPPVDAKYEA